MIAFPTSASACSCAEVPDVQSELNRSQSVFNGKVLDIKEKRGQKGYMHKSVLFEVTEVWKGPQQTQIMISTGFGGGDCGIDFQKGQEYLVYAYETDFYGPVALETTICDRTNTLQSAQDDLTILGKGQPPNEEVDLLSEEKGSQLFIWVVGVLIVGMAFALFLIRNNRSK